MPVIGYGSHGNKMVAEAAYMCIIAEQSRYFTTARSKGKEEVIVPLDFISSTACRTHGSNRFTAVYHTGR